MADSKVEIPLEGSALNSSLAAKVNEYWIERRIRFGDSVDATMNSSIESHLNRRIDARRIDRFYHQFYEELDGLKRTVSSRVDAFVSVLFPSA